MTIKGLSHKKQVSLRSTSRLQGARRPEPLRCDIERSTRLLGCEVPWVALREVPLEALLGDTIGDAALCADRTDAAGGSDGMEQLRDGSRRLARTLTILHGSMMRTVRRPFSSAPRLSTCALLPFSSGFDRPPVIVTMSPGCGT